MRVLAVGTGILSAMLAARLGVPHLLRHDQIASDDFVLDGTAFSVADSVVLDETLRRRGAEIDALVWGCGGSAAVIDRYQGRIVEVTPGEELLENVLSGLRELLIAR